MHDRFVLAERRRNDGCVKRLAIVLLVGALSACSLVRGGAEVITPQVHLVDLDMLEAGIFEQRFRVTLRVVNPNDFDLPIDGMRFGLDLNGLHFADGFSGAAVTVPRLGYARVTLDALTSTLDVARQVLALSRGEKLDYDLDGSAFIQRAGRHEIPFHQEGRLEVLPSDAVRRFVPTAPSAP